MAKENKENKRTRAGEREKAVAMRYDQERNDAPVVTAKGEGLLARRIVEVARAADVPVVEDAALVSALLSLELGQEIPVELYEAVARILSWIYRLEKGEQK